MAQLDGLRRHAETPKSPNSPTIEQLLQGDSPSWPSTPSPTFGKDHDEDQAHHNKKSVLTKVKEKAKKWRQTLVKKKHGHDDNTTPPWGVSLDDDEDEEDPEYLGAPMYKSELAPEGYKEGPRQRRRAVPVISEKHVLASSVQQDVEQEKEKPSSPNKTLTETVTKKLAPAYATVSEATHTIASKIQGLTIATPAASGSVEHASSGEQKWDKGVSVKEYLMQKLEPGEDEKALSQVISEAISPRKTPGDVGVVEKVREAVTSLLRTEESSPSSTFRTTHSSSHIPISTNAHEVIEEENHGRILQAN